MYVQLLQAAKRRKIQSGRDKHAVYNTSKESDKKQRLKCVEEVSMCKFKQCLIGLLGTLLKL